MDSSIPQSSLKYIDQKYDQLECISQGEFSTVYLAQERTGHRRMVAFKSIRMSDDKERKDRYIREINALCALNQEDKQWHREKSIVHIQEWFVLENLLHAFIVTRYIVGDTLAALIEANITFSERRIAWYVLQLCETLIYIHERGIAHYNLNPKGILVDSNNGGKLLLSDFGSSTPKGHDVVDCEISHAPPELLATQRSDDPIEGMQKLDMSAVGSFSIGCVALELVAAVPISRMKGLHGRCIGDYLNQPKSSLPELVPQMNEDSIFSTLLREYLISELLRPDPKERANVTFIPQALRVDPKSPLLAPVLKATYPARYREHVTVDNVALGLFVQRGPNWKQNDNQDNGEGSIGVVTSLDPDALYTTVTWSNRQSGTYRIGAKNQAEIVVGPPIMNGKPDGLLMTESASKYEVGQPYNPTQRHAHGVNNNFVVVKITKLSEDDKGLIFVAPTSPWPNSPTTIEKIPIRSRWTYNKKVVPHRPESAPSYWSQPNHAVWNPNGSWLPKVIDQQEQDFVIAMAFALVQDGYKILSVQRVQSPSLWDAYARRREEIALENWGCPNEQRLFHGTSSVQPDTIINDPIGFDPRFCDQGAFGRGSYFAVNPMYSDAYRYSPPHSMIYQMFVARVALGRVQNLAGTRHASDIRRPEKGCHSVRGTSMNRKRQKSEIYILYETDTQAYPEYLITYGHA